VVVLFPLLVIVAIALIVRRHATTSGGEGWPWFLAWTASGALLFSSFLTGFSIGLFILPFAAVVMIWTAGRSPHGAEALGFLLGVGLVLLFIASVNSWRGWHVAGIGFCLAGVFGYAAALTHRERSTAG
jgi:hypothetical protein